MSDEAVSITVDHLFRHEYGKMVAVLSRGFGFDRLSLAEDLVQETLIAAMHSWSVNGLPDNPAAWLMTVAKNKARNQLKHEGRKGRIHGQMQVEERDDRSPQVFFDSDIADSQLRLMFGCCHPDIARSDQLALILKTLGGFGVGEIARALLLGEEAVAKRIYRAKHRISDRKIALDVPGGPELDARVDAVHQALYLLFNEGYSPSESEEVIRRDLCDEAIRLCGLMTERFGEHRGGWALHALMNFHAARFDSRIGDGGAVVLFADQSRATWDRSLIERGMISLSRSASGEVLTAFHIEASIAAQHCIAPSMDATNWAFIRQLYERLMVLKPSPLIKLNLGIVTLMIEGPRAAIIQVETLREDRKLKKHPLLWATLGSLYAHLDQTDAARRAYAKAGALSESPRERLVLSGRIATL